MLYGLVFFPMIMSLPVWLIGKRHKKARNIAAAAVTLLELAMATALLWMPDMNASIGGVDHLLVTAQINIK